MVGPADLPDSFQQGLEEGMRLPRQGGGSGCVEHRGGEGGGSGGGTGGGCAHGGWPGLSERKSLLRKPGSPY